MNLSVLLPLSATKQQHLERCTLSTSVGFPAKMGTRRDERTDGHTRRDVQIKALGRSGGYSLSRKAAPSPPTPFLVAFSVGRTDWSFDSYLSFEASFFCGADAVRVWCAGRSPLISFLVCRSFILLPPHHQHLRRPRFNQSPLDERKKANGAHEWLRVIFAANARFLLPTPVVLPQYSLDSGRVTDLPPCIAGA